MKINKISIIIPIYNVSDYIERCIMSVMNQTYSGPIECILVDDCSPDDSIFKCQKLINNYLGNIEFKIIRHKENLGLSGARNTGTKISCGEYLFYLDSDDEITVTCIQDLVNAVIEHGFPQMVIGSTESIPNDSNYYSIDRYKKIEQPITNSWVRKNFYCFDDRLPVNAWNKLISRDFLVENKLFFLQGVIHEDEQWMFFVVKKLQTLGFVFKTTLLHYKNPNSIMSTSNRDKAAKNWLLILKSFVGHFDNPFYCEQVLVYLWQFVVVYGNRNFKKESQELFVVFYHLLYDLRQYSLCILLVLLKYSYKILRGRGLRKVIKLILKKKLTDDNRICFN